MELVVDVLELAAEVGDRVLQLIHSTAQVIDAVGQIVSVAKQPSGPASGTMGRLRRSHKLSHQVRSSSPALAWQRQRWTACRMAMRKSSAPS